MNPAALTLGADYRGQGLPLVTGRLGSECPWRGWTRRKCCSGPVGRAFPVETIAVGSDSCLLMGYCFNFLGFTPLSFFLRAAHVAYGGSQDRGWNRSYSGRPTPQPQQLLIPATSVTYTTAHGHAGSLTHGARPGMETASLWILVGFVSAEPRWEHLLLFLIRMAG